MSDEGILYLTSMALQGSVLIGEENHPPPETLELELGMLVKAMGVDKRHYFKVLRKRLTGGDSGPSIYALMAVIGMDKIRTKLNLETAMFVSEYDAEVAERIWANE